MAIFENVDGKPVVVGTGTHENVGHAEAASISKTQTASHQDANHVLHEVRQTVTEDVHGRSSISQTDTYVDKGVKYVSSIAADENGHVAVAGTQSIETTDKHGEVHRESVSVSMPWVPGMSSKKAEADVKSLAGAQMKALHNGEPLAVHDGVTTEVSRATIQTAKDGSSFVHQETLGVNGHGVSASLDDISTRSMGKGISQIETRHQDALGGLAVSERVEVHSRGQKGEDVVAQHTETLSGHTVAARSWAYGGAEKELASGGFGVDTGLKKGLGEHVGAAGGTGPAHLAGEAGPGHLLGGAGPLPLPGGAGIAGHVLSGAGGVGMGEHVAGGRGPDTSSLSSHTHDSIVSYLTDKAGYAAQEAKSLVDGVSEFLGKAIDSHAIGMGGTLEFNKTGAEAVSLNQGTNAGMVASNDGNTASIPMDRLKSVHESGMVQDLASRDMGSQSHVQELSR